MYLQKDDTVVSVLLFILTIDIYLKTDIENIKNRDKLTTTILNTDKQVAGQEQELVISYCNKILLEKCKPRRSIFDFNK